MFFHSEKLQKHYHFGFLEPREYLETLRDTSAVVFAKRIMQIDGLELEL